MNEFFARIEKNKALSESHQHIVTKRHWGTAITLDANTRINSLFGEPSAHFHRYRSEEYIVYEGGMILYRGEAYEGDLERTVGNMKPTFLKPGDRAVIEPEVVHIPIPQNKNGAVFIEVSHGPYEDSDIVRVYDKTGRDAQLAARWAVLGYKEGLGIKNLIRQINS